LLDRQSPRYKTRVPTLLEVGIGIVTRRSPLQFLVCQRRLDDYWGGWWEFPGGKLNPGESIPECIARELREELGIQVTVAQQLPIVEHLYADRDRLVRLHPHLCDLLAGEPAPVEAQAVRWCPADELPNLKFLPANGPIIQAALAALAE